MVSCRDLRVLKIKMDRWCGALRVSISPNSSAHFNVAASLCLSSSSKTLTVPSLNAILFNGDRIEGTENPVIEKLSDTRNVAELLVSKLGSSVNAWVVEASTFNGPFAIFKELIPSVNSWGEPKSYNPDGFPASTSTVLLLSSCLEEAKNVIYGGKREPPLVGASATCPNQPKTIVLGFSKGGTILNQLVTELAHSKLESLTMGGNHANIQEENQIIPRSKESFLNSVSEIHYVDAGLNCSGAYLTDNSVIERISKCMTLGAPGIRFGLHGTPRQWCDSRRSWVRHEKDILLKLLEDSAQKTSGKVQVFNRLYFGDRPPNLEMHFEIIERLDLS